MQKGELENLREQGGTGPGRPWNLPKTVLRLLPAPSCIHPIGGTKGLRDGKFVTSTDEGTVAALCHCAVCVCNVCVV